MKFAHLAEKSEKGSISNLSTKVLRNTGMADMRRRRASIAAPRELIAAEESPEGSETDERADKPEGGGLRPFAQRLQKLNQRMDAERAKEEKAD